MSRVSRVSVVNHTFVSSPRLHIDISYFALNTYMYNVQYVTNNGYLDKFVSAEHCFLKINR